MMRERQHTVSGAFVFLLLGVFAVFSMLLVLLGARAYRVTVDEASRQNATRILSAFVRNAVQAADRADTLQVLDESGLSVLALTTDEDGERYTQYIYCWEGELRELFTNTDHGFSPEDGQSLCAAQSFEAELIDGLLTVAMTDVDGMPINVTIAPRCASQGGRVW